MLNFKFLNSKSLKNTKLMQIEEEKIHFEGFKVHLTFVKIDFSLVRFTMSKLIPEVLRK